MILNEQVRCDPGDGFGDTSNDLKPPPGDVNDYKTWRSTRVEHLICSTKNKNKKSKTIIINHHPDSNNILSK